MFSRTYCCCAVPLYNAGIYAIIAQFLIISLVCGVLSFAAPNIVAVAIPSFGPYLFGAFCILVAVTQVVGFFGVYRERPNLFKTYSRFNKLFVACALILALAFIIVSAVQHNTAVANCQALFSTQTAANNTTGPNSNVTSSSGICNVWTWVQLGIMGLLFIIITLSEAYFLRLQSVYLSEQKADHARYDSVYTTAEREIRESGLWDHTDPTNPYARSSQDVNDYRNNPNARPMSGLRREVVPSHGDDYDEQRGESQEYLTQEKSYRGDRMSDGSGIDYGYVNEKNDGSPRRGRLQRSQGSQEQYRS